MIDSAKYQAQASELSQKLWAIANDLRGNMDSTKFRNYILGTIFYSYLSERTEEYMQEILKEDGLTYEQAFSDADYRPIVEQWSIEHLGYIVKPENLFRELVRKIVRPKDDADRFSVEDYERAVNELTGSTMGQASEAAFSGLFNDMKLQDPDLGDTVAERTALIAKVIVKISEIDFSLSDSQFDVLGTAYMILIGLFASGAGKLPPKSHADYAFVEHMIYHMDDDDGRVAVLLPHGVLFRGGAEEVIRKYIVRDLNRLDAVIGLAPNLFHGTSIPVCLLVLKTKRNGNSGNVLFIDASKEFKPGKNQNTLEDEHIQRIVDAYVKREDVDKFAHVADMAEIEANGWNLNIPRYVDTFEEEKPVDLEAVRADLERIGAEKKAAIDKAESMLRQLGL